jgi:hypothetical protein
MRDPVSITDESCGRLFACTGTFLALPGGCLDASLFSCFDVEFNRALVANPRQEQCRLFSTCLLLEERIKAACREYAVTRGRNAQDTRLGAMMVMRLLAVSIGANAPEVHMKDTGRVRWIYS